MLETNYGPILPVSEETHAAKYRGPNEIFYDAVCRQAGALCDDESHRREVKRILLQMGFLPAGRVQRAVGSPHKVTPYNCFVSGTIEDDSSSIMEMAKEAMLTMRMGGGIGYDFSEIRPMGDLIKSLGSHASGPVSFMEIYNAVCKTVMSSGHRRGAQMGVLRVDHPDIETFVSSKKASMEMQPLWDLVNSLADESGGKQALLASLQHTLGLTKFNISVAITDEFMNAVKDGEDFALTFGGKEYSRIDARALWDKIMRSTWDWAEPGVLFIDRINYMNNLSYCETIAATNPCGEQPLPPYGACLLGSFNTTKYLIQRAGKWIFDIEAFRADIPPIVRAMDNVVNIATYPLPEHEVEAKAKRRMGLGVTGVANTLEIMGMSYGDDEYLKAQDTILLTLRDEAYRASAMLAKEKGAFPLYDEQYLDAPFIKTLQPATRALIGQHGIRNSHLLSIAPTGTISLSADNISSGIEPVFSHEYDRTIQTDNGPVTQKVTDYAYREFGVKGMAADDLAPEKHVNVLIHAQKYVDSAVSKTCNVGEDVGWERFKDIYMAAWEGGAKGCTTFRAAGKRMGILKKTEASGPACEIDPVTGIKSCE